MIGARFYTQLDAAQNHSDNVENELSKEMENGRLFRLLVKLGSINERPEYYIFIYNTMFLFFSVYVNFCFLDLTWILHGQKLVIVTC